MRQIKLDILARHNYTKWQKIIFAGQLEMSFFGPTLIICSFDFIINHQLLEPTSIGFIYVLNN